MRNFGILKIVKQLLLGLVYGIFFLLPVSVVAAYLGSAMLHGAAAARLWIPLYVGCYYLGFCHAGRILDRSGTAVAGGELP